MNTSRTDPMATPQDLLSALGRAYALTDAPFDSDQDYLDALQAVVETQDDLGWLVVRVEESGFRVGDEAFADLPDGAGLLEAHLRDAGIAEVRFQETLQIQILQEFLRQVHPTSRVEGMTPSARFRGFEDTLGLSFTGGGKPGRGMTGGIQKLFQGWEKPVQESDGNGGGVMSDSPPGVKESSDEDLPPEVQAEEAPAVEDAPPEPEPEFAVSGDFGAVMDHLLAEGPDEVVLDAEAGRGEVAEPAEDLAAGPAEDVAADPAQDLGPEVAEPAEDVAAVEFQELSEPSTEEAELRDRVRDLTAARDFKGLADLVVDLVDPSNETFRPDVAERLAEEFTTPAVASSIVASLATSRDEGKRARLGKAVARIGREGPPAVADALEMARDRSERRALVEAMVALGPRGFDLARRMVEDSRWYVVRNGVSVMGEVGGEEAVTHLTATLASSDSRVRRETVRALAKLGGADAEALVLGMLSDPEAPVRAVACRAVGVLGLGRAVRPLLELLKDPDQEVQVEAIQALGLIGDPGPVQQIEKKALGGFLAKPAAPIRVAAFRALAAIGTPRALKTLQKGASDPDEEVKASVRSLLRA